MIHHITIDQLKGITNEDGLILRGCGGEVTDWQNGINEMLTEAGILKNGGEFKDIYVFKDEELTNILYPFDNITPDKLDIGKLAMWRLHMHDNFAGIWYSDYLDNLPNIDREEVEELSSDIDTKEDSAVSIHPISICINNAYESSDNSFEIPLPTTKKKIQPLLEKADIENWRDIQIDAIHSDMLPGVGKRLQRIISDNGITPDTLDELNYLATRIHDLLVEDGEFERDIFSGNIEAGYNCGSIKEIINLTYEENMKCYDIFPIFDIEDYGEYLVMQHLQDAHAEAFTRLSDSKNPEDRALVAHIEKLEKHIDYEAFGKTTAKEENGTIIEQGYLLGGEGFQDFYQGVQDIPTECHLLAQSEKNVERLMIINDVNITETIVKLHAVGCRNMEHVADNVKSFLDEHNRFAEGESPSLVDNYILVLNRQSISIAPVAEIYKQDSEMFKFALDMARKAEQNRPDIRIFAVRVNNDNNEVAGQGARGDFIELSPKALASHISHHAVSPTSAYIFQNNGLKYPCDLYTWGLELQKRGKFVDYTLNYSNQEIHRVTATLYEFIENHEISSLAESFEFHLPRISNPYKSTTMVENENPHPYDGLIRIDKESAKEILASENTEVYNLADDKVTKVNIFEFLRPASFSEYNNLAIKHSDAKILDKWAERKVGEIVQQMEHGELNKTSGKEECE